MPVLTDPNVLAVIVEAFSLSTRGIRGYLTWKGSAAENVRRLLPGYTPELIEDLAFEHLSNGGAVRYAKETREGFEDFDFHYDIVIPEEPVPIYLETVILRMCPTDPGVEVKNCHPNLN